MDTNNIVEMRQKYEGGHERRADLSQALKTILRVHGLYNLPVLHREMVEEIASLLSKLVIGDSHHQFHWDNIGACAKIGSNGVKLVNSVSDAINDSISGHDSELEAALNDAATKYDSSIEDAYEEPSLLDDIKRAPTY